MNKQTTGKKIIVQNKKVFHDFFVEETYEAGIELVGSEVKSLRAGKANLKDSYIDIRNGEAYIYGMHISPYDHGNIFNRDPERDRRLLLHKREIMKLFGLVKQDGYTLVPTKLYFSGSNIKVEVALARGKKLYDKRDDAAKRDAKRNMERELRVRNM